MSQIEKLAGKEEQTVKCKSCGASIPVRDRFCTFCGAVNEIGDELEYQKKLEDIREDMQQLENVSAETYRKEVKKSAKGIGIIAVIVAIVIAIFAGIFCVFRFVSSKKEEAVVMDEIAWERETFPMLNALYDEEKYDEVMDYYNNFYSGGDWKHYNLESWEHSIFFRMYRSYTNIQLNIEMIENSSEIHQDDVGRVFEDCMKVAMTDWKRADYSHSLTERDFERIKEYQDNVWEILEEHFKLSFRDIDDEYEEFFNTDVTLVEPDGNKCFEKGKTLTWY